MMRSDNIGRRSRIRGWRKIALLMATAQVVLDVTLGGESSSTQYENDSSSSAGHHGAIASGGRIVQSLFRFPASQFGPEFDALLQNWYTDWLQVTKTSTAVYDLPSITPEPAGKTHALYSVSTPAATLFRRQCYGPAPRKTPQLRNLYTNFEQRRKSLSFEYVNDAGEEMRLSHIMTKKIYPAFLPNDDSKNSRKQNNHDARKSVHKKKSMSTVGTIHARSTLPNDYDDPSRLTFQTINSGSKSKDISNNNKETQQWSWYPPGYFSLRGTPKNLPFRKKMYRLMRNQLQQRLQQLLPDSFKDGFEYGRQSGMFWYPPGGVREWHNNYLDLVGNMQGGGSKKEEKIFATQVWRMYVVRTVRDADFDEKLARFRKTGDVDQSSNDHSAMHIIPGEDSGITLDVLRKAGARPLTKQEEMRQWSDEFAEDYFIPAEHNSPNDDFDRDDNSDLLDRNSVWRVPDQDGYVTLFRLPDIWHCIVSEEVDRYSLGFAFSDREVQAMLRLAGVEFDVEGDKEQGSDTTTKDEL